MKKSLFALAALTASLSAATAQPLPQPRIVVIDRAAILQFSKAGQDIAKQVQAYANQAKADLAAQDRSLRAQAQTLQSQNQALEQQIAIMSADAKAKKVAEFRGKEESLQRQAESLQKLSQGKEAQIQGGFLQARAAMEKMLGPILKDIIQARGANMVLDKQAVVYASNQSFDVTMEAINKLNAQMPSYHVTLQAPPQQAPGVTAQK